jgi:DsbC/DsbD-like thiol-disulfide interchange protein
MRTLISRLTASCWLIAALAGSPAVHALTGDTVSTENVKARLISESNAIGPGQSIWVALELDIRDGWHTYWRNPGDSGQATQLAWTLPAGIAAGDIVWATPHRFEIAPLVNYGYAKHAMHLVKITAAPDLKAGAPLDLAAKATWLVCADVCIPESVGLHLRLPVQSGGGSADPAVAPLFAAARADLPGNAPATSEAKIQDGKLVLTLGRDWGATLSQVRSLAFYPYDDGAIEYAAPQTLTRKDGSIELSTKLGYQPPKSGPVRGVLIATERSGNDSLSVPIEIAATLAPGAAATGRATAKDRAATGRGPERRRRRARPAAVG